MRKQQSFYQVAARKNRKTLAKLSIPKGPFDIQCDVENESHSIASAFIAHGPSDYRKEDRKRVLTHFKHAEGPIRPFAKSLRRSLMRSTVPYSLASSRMIGKFAQRLSGEVLKLIDESESEELRFLTLVGRWLFLPHELDCNTLRRIHEQLKTHFKRAHVTDATGWLVGSLDGSYDGKFISIHLHAIVSGNKIDAIDAKLRKLRCYKRLDPSETPVRLDHVNDSRCQTSYCFKTWWAADHEAEERHPSKKNVKRFRMPSNAEAAYLQMLHETPVTDWLILNGVRLGAHGLKLN